MAAKRKFESRMGQGRGEFRMKVSFPKDTEWAKGMSVANSTLVAGSRLPPLRFSTAQSPGTCAAHPEVPRASQEGSWRASSTHTDLKALRSPPGLLLFLASSGRCILTPLSYVVWNLFSNLVGDTLFYLFP